jgi:hypothetical protein
MKHAGAVFAGGRVTSGGKKLTSEKRKPKKPLEALNKGLSLSLDSGRIRLCEAPCGADAAFSEIPFA